MAAGLREQLQNAEAALAAIPEETTDFASAVRNISRNLQEVSLRQKALAQEGHAYTQALKDLRAGEARQTEKARTLSRVSYSLQWQEIPLSDINGLQELLIQRRNLGNQTATAQNRVQTLEAVPGPSAEVLRVEQHQPRPTDWPAGIASARSKRGGWALPLVSTRVEPGAATTSVRGFCDPHPRNRSRPEPGSVPQRKHCNNGRGPRPSCLRAKERAGTLAEQHLQLNQAVESGAMITMCLKGTWRRSRKSFTPIAAWPRPNSPLILMVCAFRLRGRRERRLPGNRKRQSWRPPWTG